MEQRVQSHWWSKAGLFQMVCSGFWLAIACYGFYRIYFHRLGRYGNDKIGMLLFLLIGVFALVSLIQLFVGRALIFDGEFVHVRTLFGTEKIALRDITNAWWTMPEYGVIDLLTSKSTWGHLFNVTIGFDGETMVLHEKEIGRGWNKAELNAFCENVNAHIPHKKARV